MGILQAGILEWVCHFLLPGTFLTQGLNPGSLHCRWILYLHLLGSLYSLAYVILIFKNEIILTFYSAFFFFHLMIHLGCFSLLAQEDLKLSMPASRRTVRGELW